MLHQEKIPLYINIPGKPTFTKYYTRKTNFYIVLLQYYTMKTNLYSVTPGKPSCTVLHQENHHVQCYTRNTNLYKVLHQEKLPLQCITPGKTTFTQYYTNKTAFTTLYSVTPGKVTFI